MADERTLRDAEYVKRLEVNALRREVYGRPDPAGSESLMDELARGEAELSALERQRSTVLAGPNSPHGGSDGRFDLRGASTTGLAVDTALHMAHVPTSIYHLLDRGDHPLVSARVRNTKPSGRPRRIRVTSFIEGYSARAVDTVELESLDEAAFDQLPTLFPDRIRDIAELTNATLNVLVEDIEGTVEVHRTQTVRLLARTTAPLAVMDPSSHLWTDLTRYFGAFVTPNSPTVQSFLRAAADLHPDRRLVGYQGAPEDVEPQVNALFGALKAADIAYVNSVIAFSPEDGAATQRVRLPRESLADRQANCVDGAVLMASLLEGISMSPAIVVVPGHVFVAWETWRDSDDWRYLETTMIGSSRFEEASHSAERTARRYQRLAEKTGDPLRFRRWSLRDLRSTYRITPME